MFLPLQCRSGLEEQLQLHIDELSVVRGQADTLQIGHENSHQYIQHCLLLNLYITPSSFLTIRSTSSYPLISSSPKYYLPFSSFIIPFAHSLLYSLKFIIFTHIFLDPLLLPSLPPSYSSNLSPPPHPSLPSSSFSLMTSSILLSTFTLPNPPFFSPPSLAACLLSVRQTFRLPL